MMPGGFGRGYGRGIGAGMGRSMGRGMGRGFGFAFRGSSPPWPYIGRGRGGLPRCGYFLGGAPGTQGYYNQYPAYTGAYYSPEYSRFDPAASSGQGLGSLKEQAEMIKQELASIHSRINQIEKDQER